MAKFAIYQVLPRLFGNPIAQPKLNGTILENGSGKFGHFTDKVLQSIQKLGITHIWYTGIIRHATTSSYTGIPDSNHTIVKGKAGSPYAITDYYDVDPDLAENSEDRINEFEQLVERTHKNGLQVLIDFVPNHLGRQYKSIMKPDNVEDFGASDDVNKNFDAQNNFYYLPNESLSLPFPSDFQESPAKASGNDVFNAYPQEHDWYETIKLNYGIDYQNNNQTHFHPTPKTWIMMLDVLLYWTAKGIDGFRCDMAEMVPVEFWEWVIPQIKNKNPEIVFIAEIYNTDSYDRFIQQGKFDYLYDKVDLYDSLRTIMEHNQPVEIISKVWQKLNGKDKYMLRFLENHDEQRLASKNFIQYAPRALPAFFLTACMHQNPFMIYFGQEFGEEAKGASGFSGNDGRTSIFDYWQVPTIQEWIYRAKLNIENLSVEKQILYSQYQEIIRFSLSKKAMTEGIFYDLMWINKDNPNFNSKVIFAFIRTFGQENYLCLANFSRENQQLNVQINEEACEFCNIKKAKLFNFEFLDYFSKRSLKISGFECLEKGIPIELPPFSYAAYQF